LEYFFGNNNVEVGEERVLRLIASQWRERRRRDQLRTHASFSTVNPELILRLLGGEQDHVVVVLLLKRQYLILFTMASAAGAWTTVTAPDGKEYYYKCATCSTMSKGQFTNID